MIARLRREYWKLGGSAAQLVVIVIAAQFESIMAWRIAAAAVAALSLLSWVLALRHIRAVADTPTSKVASAAQGYVELHGVGHAFDGSPVTAQLTHTPCLWYRFLIERRSDNKWRTESSGESETSIILDDGTGQCLVDPEGAQIIPEHRQHWTEGNHRYTEWRIHENETVYAIGHFVTRTSATLELDLNEGMRELLAQWKQDPGQLNQRFDLDRNGTLDLREWELARAQARREVLAMHREARAGADVHVMHAPLDRRLYLIATISPELIERRYRWWAAFHVTCFVASLGVLGYLLELH